jgi:hypothetical protein
MEVWGWVGLGGNGGWRWRQWSFYGGVVLAGFWYCKAMLPAWQYSKLTGKPAIAQAAEDGCRGQ